MQTAESLCNTEHLNFLIGRMVAARLGHTSLHAIIQIYFLILLLPLVTLFRPLLF